MPICESKTSAPDVPSKIYPLRHDSQLSYKMKMNHNLPQGTAKLGGSQAMRSFFYIVFLMPSNLRSIILQK